jgi:hypothetical protein
VFVVVVLVVVVLVLVNVNVNVSRTATADTSSPAARTLAGSVVIQNHGEPVLLTPPACEAISAPRSPETVVLRAGPHRTSRAGLAPTTFLGPPSTERVPCRFTFVIRNVPRAQRYSLTIAGTSAGHWNRDELRHRAWMVYFDAQGGAHPEKWQLAEVQQLHPGDAVPIPSDSAVAAPKGVAFDAISWRQVWTTTAGSTERECVDVADRSNVRSGTFVVGNFASYRQYWSGTLDTSKLYYVPMNPTGHPPLVVTAQSLDDPTDTVSPLQQAGEAWGADGDFFYATGTVLPHRGRWRLTVTAGTNWGCFDLTL